MDRSGAKHPLQTKNRVFDCRVMIHTGQDHPAGLPWEAAMGLRRWKGKRAIPWPRNQDRGRWGPESLWRRTQHWEEAEGPSFSYVYVSTKGISTSNAVGIWEGVPVSISSLACLRGGSFYASCLYLGLWGASCKKIGEWELSRPCSALRDVRVFMQWDTVIQQRAGLMEDPKQG